MQKRGSYKGIGFWLLTMVMALTMGAGLQTGCSKVNATEITSVSYMDTDGTEKTIDSTKVIEVTEATTELAGGEEPVWYVVKAGPSITTGTADKAVRISVTGKVNLILEDDARWTANGGIGIADDGVFTVYGQKEGTGTLIAQNVKNGYAGIGTKEGSQGNTTIVLNGGHIKATGSMSSAGIGNGGLDDPTKSEVIINGGRIEAVGGSNGAGGYEVCAGIGSMYITINRGTVTAIGGRRGAGIGSCSDKKNVEVDIKGGTIIATGGVNIAGI